MIILDSSLISHNRWKALKDYAQLGGEIIILADYANLNNIFANLELTSDFRQPEISTQRFLGNNYTIRAQTSNYFSGSVTKISITEEKNITKGLQILTRFFFQKDDSKVLSITKEFLNFNDTTFSQIFSQHSSQSVNYELLLIPLLITFAMIAILISIRFLKTTSENLNIITLIIIFSVLSAFVYFFIDERKFSASEFQVEASVNNIQKENPILNWTLVHYEVFRKSSIRFTETDKNLYLILNSNYIADKVQFIWTENALTVECFAQINLFIAQINFVKPALPISILTNNKQKVLLNSSNAELTDILFFDEFQGAKILDVKSYSSTILQKPEIPYRRLISIEKTDNFHQVITKNIARQLIFRNRRFIIGILAPQKPKQKIIKLIVLN